MAQGDYGTPSNRLNIVSDRWKYTPHISDPPDTEKGDEWLRVDMDSGDKIATLRFQYNSSGDIWDIPVFPEGLSGSGVEEVLSFDTPNGKGFIPLVEGNGWFSQRRFQFNGNVHSYHAEPTEYLPIDDYEDDVFSEYTARNLSSEPSLNTTDVQSGDSSAYIATTSTDKIYGGHMVSTGGLPYYPSAGDRILWHFKNLDNGVDGGLSLYFGVQSEGDSTFEGYQLLHANSGTVPGNTESDRGFALFRLNGDGTSDLILDATGSSTTDGGWASTYFGDRLWINWTESGIELAGENNTYFGETTDTTFQSGGIGIGVWSENGSEEEAIFDDMHFYIL